MEASDLSSIIKEKQVPGNNHIIKWSPKLRLPVFILPATNIPRHYTWVYSIKMRCTDLSEKRIQRESKEHSLSHAKPFDSLLLLFHSP